MSRYDKGEELVARLRYEQPTGSLIWVDGPNAGREAGGCCVIQRKPAHKPYTLRIITYKGHRFACAHLVWRITFGTWPDAGIDHIDGNPLNNRPQNLRLSTPAQNAQNRLARVDNRAGGLVGVSWHKLRSRWRASIGINRRQVHLGLFDTQEEAHKAYLAAKAKLHTFNPVPRTTTTGTSANDDNFTPTPHSTCDRRARSTRKSPAQPQGVHGR